MSDTISDSLQILSMLRSINTEAKGVPKSLGSTIDDSTTDDVSPSLTQNEQTRTENIGLILGDAIGRVLEIGKYKKGPEARRLEDLTPDTKPLGQSIIPSSVITNTSNQTGDGSDLLKTLGIGALLYSLLKGNFSGIAQSIYRAIKPNLSKLGSFFQKPLDRLKQGLKNQLGKVVTRITDFGKSLSSKLSSYLDSIKNSKILKGLKSQITSLKQSIVNVFDNTIDNVISTVSTIASKLTSLSKVVTTQLAKIPGASALSRAAQNVSPIIGSVKSFTTDAISSLGRGIRTTATNLGSAVLKPLKDRAFAQAGRLLTSKGGEKGLVNFFKKAFNRIPLVSPFVELLFGSGDIKKFKEEYANGKIDITTLQQKSGNRVLEGLIGVLGGGAGAVVGTALGGPIGTFLGSIAGDVAGRYLLAPLAKSILPETSLQKVGSIVTGTEMQDFLVKEGKVYSFSSKDEVLGMKTGGAIDNLMKDLTTSITVDNKFIKQALVQQIKQQDVVIDVLTAILNKREVPVVVNSQQRTVNYVNDDIRSALNNQQPLAYSS